MKLFEDTNPEAEHVYINLMSIAPSWKKISVIDHLYLTSVSMVRLSVLRKYPNVNNVKLRNETAKLILGEDVSKKIYDT